MVNHDTKNNMDHLLLGKSLLLVSGKGGVGKTAVSAALAYRAKALGRKAFLFCCDAPSQLNLSRQGVPSMPPFKKYCPAFGQ